MNTKKFLDKPGFPTKKILMNPDLFSDKGQNCFYMKPDSNNPVPKPALSRFQGAKCGRQAEGALLPDLPQVFLRVTNYKDLGLSSKSQPDYPDEKATSLPIYLELSCQHQ